LLLLLGGRLLAGDCPTTAVGGNHTPAPAWPVIVLCSLHHEAEPSQGHGERTQASGDDALEKRIDVSEKRSGCGP